MQPHVDVPFKISGLDSAVFEAWTRTGLRDSSRSIDIIHPDRLMNLLSLVRKKPLISRDELIEEGNILDRNEKRAIASKSISSRKAKRDANRTKKMAKEVQGTIEVLKKRVERMNESNDDELEDCQNGDRVNQVASTTAHVTRSSPLSGVKVGPSLSTKLNYILSEVRLHTCVDDVDHIPHARSQVQRYSAKEKFLIFSNSLLTLSQISEALSLFRFRYLRYTNEEKDSMLREQCILTFETSDVHRILLIDLKLGARGLSVHQMDATSDTNIFCRNLISASRVIFCEPVWHPDVESQAIKV
jgi:SNF2 family DNA or RNA helicase